ncbi:MAG: hypothetical protein WC124_04085 [Desulfoplanes sp.]
MKELEQISLYEFSEILQSMETLYAQDPETYQDFLGEICAEFPLSKEYMLAIKHMAGQGADEVVIKQADLNMRHLMALWIIAQEKTVPLTEGAVQQ